MKNLLFYGILSLAPILFAFTKIDDGTKLADELVGIYSGMYAKDGVLNKEFKVKVTKLSDEMIQVSPFDGTGCTGFKAKVWEDNLSAIRVIRLEPVGGIVLKNGMITPVNGRLSYGISSSNGLKLEVFSGIKH